MTRADPSKPNLTREEVCRRYYEKNKKIISEKARDKRQCYRINNIEEITIKENAKKAELEKQKEERRELIRSLKEKDRVERIEARNIRTAENKILNKEKNLESRRIAKWIKRGVIHDDYKALYQNYINTKYCDKCNVELVSGIYGANKRCLDHSHITGEFRNVLCNTCNTCSEARKNP